MTAAPETEAIPVAAAAGRAGVPPREAAGSIMIVAGEASGDLHGAALCRALRALAPEYRLIGMGGPRMAQAGMEVSVDVTGEASVGVVEVVGRVAGLWRAFRRLRTLLVRHPRPRALVIIDFPEFNLRLARAARRAGVPVVYFVPPQIWAWRGGRIRTIRRLVSLVLAVFPFEAPLYRRAGVAVEFVGHPLLDQLAGAPSREEARRALGIAPETEVVGLLPGSRRQEIEGVLPLMHEAAARLVAVRPGLRFVLALAPSIPREAAQRFVGASPAIAIVSQRTREVMRAADVLLVTSGTATLEAALLGTPMVVCYRLTAITEALVRLLIRVPWISLPNLTLGRDVVPELYRKETTGARLAQEALRLLEDRGAGVSQRTAFAELASELGTAGVGTRAARLVLATASASP